MRRKSGIRAADSHDNDEVVLVGIEDEDSSRLFGKILEDQGYDVTFCPNPAACLTSLRKPSLTGKKVPGRFVVDLDYDREAAFAFVKKVCRSHLAPRAIAVGPADRGLRESIQNMGGAYLEKPFRLERIMRLIRTAG